MASPSIATEFSSEEPSAKPACHSFLTSLTKPNVRARAISLRKVEGSRSKTRRWRPIAREFEIDLDVEAKAAIGWQEFREGPALLDPHRLETLRYRRGRDCLTRPTESIAATKWADEPSMIGVSGPSISTRALSTCRPEARPSDARPCRRSRPTRRRARCRARSAVTLTAWLRSGARDRPAGRCEERRCQCRRRRDEG